MQSLVCHPSPVPKGSFRAQRSTGVGDGSLRVFNDLGLGCGCAVLCCAGPNLPSARCTYPLAQDQQLFPDDFHFPLKLLKSVCNLKPQQQLGSPRIEQDVTVIVMQLRICLMHNFATMLPIDKEYIFLLWTAIQ